MKRVFYMTSLFTLISILLISCANAKISIGPKRTAELYDVKVFEALGDISLELSANISDIKIYSWKNEQAKFEITKKVRGLLHESRLEEELKNFQINISSEDGKIKYTETYSGTIGSPADRSVELKVFVPQKTQTIYLNLDMGTVEVYDDLNCALNIEMNMANVKIHRLNGVIKSISQMGDLRIGSGKLYGGSSIKTGMGNISVKSEVALHGEYNFETDMGNINLMLNKDSKISVESVGNLYINEFDTVDLGAKVKVRSDMGKISITKY